MTQALAAALVALSLVGAFVSGLVGVGGAVVMIPLLLYGPPLLGVGRLDVKTVAAVTMVQVFVAAVSGMLAHRRQGAVDGRLAAIGGVAMGAGAFVGALVSKITPDRALLVVFALMASGAIVLLLVPEPADASTTPPGAPLIVGIAGGVGVMAGLVGAGGAFLLVPLLLVVARVPLRAAIGSSLAITAMAAAAGVAGKLLTGQVQLAPALAVVAGALPGSQIGAALSHRLPGRALRATLFAVVVVSAARVWWNVFCE